MRKKRKSRRWLAQMTMSYMCPFPEGGTLLSQPVSCSELLETASAVCRYWPLQVQGERERNGFIEKILHLPVMCVDVTEMFLGNLKEVVGLERNRKIIGGEFMQFSMNFLTSYGKIPQGTLYSDVIESPPLQEAGSRTLIQYKKSPECRCFAP